MSQPNAADVYIQRHNEAEVLLRAIANGLQQHMDSVDPETVNWGDVGDVGSVVSSLREIAESLGYDPDNEYPTK